MDCTGASWLDMMVTGAWSPAAAVWAQCRYMGRVQLSGPTAALWATIHTTVHAANTMASASNLNHTHEPAILNVTAFGRSRIHAGETSRAQRLGYV